MVYDFQTKDIIIDLALLFLGSLLNRVLARQRLVVRTTVKGRGRQASCYMIDSRLHLKIERPPCQICAAAGYLNQAAKSDRNGNDDGGATFLRTGGERASLPTVKAVELRKRSASTAESEKGSIECGPLFEMMTMLNTDG